MIARRDNPGHPIQFQGVIKDISRRRDLEAQLRDHSRHLEQMVAERTGELTTTMNFLHGILEGATEYAIFGLDEAGTFVHFNRGAQLILHFDPEEMVGRRKLDHLLDFQGGEFGSLEAFLREVDLNGVLVRENVFQTGDDRNIVMHITEQKELEDLLKVYTENLEIVLEEKSQELEQKHIELIQSSKLATLGEMATGIAHEMNQPLSGIRTRAQLLTRLVAKGKLEEEKVTGSQQDIMALVDRISRIIHHMRVFARQDQQAFGAFFLTQSIDGCLSLMSEQLRLHAIEVQLSIRRDVPEVIGEPSQIEQVLLNLVGNARDAMDEKESRLVGAEARGRFRKRLEIGLERQGNNEVRLWISDNGVGMSEDVCERIFQPFWTTKSIGKGTGLGLSISYGIITKHGGRIEVESHPGEGTTFSIYLPLVRPGRGSRRMEISHEAESETPRRHESTEAIRETA
jgi:C4-dicarboxylate-specific signal transduction histidine kinase